MTQNAFTFFEFTDNTFPNLDGFPDAGDLTDFQTECKRLEAGLAKLRSYAEAKANAMTLRGQGKIVGAQRFEETADIVYEQLPEWAKW